MLTIIVSCIVTIDAYDLFSQRWTTRNLPLNIREIFISIDVPLKIPNGHS